MPGAGVEGVSLPVLAMRPVIFSINPVLARELVQRMRGAKAMFTRSGYLSLLGLIFVLVYHAELGGGFDGRFGNTVVDWASVGQGLFEWTLLFILLLALFLVPGAAAGSIVGERQRQTLIPVQISLMRPLSIVLGKLGAAIAYTLLLLTATMPLLSIAHLIGGVTLAEIVKGLGVIMFIAVCTAATSLLFSAAMGSSRTATIMSYVMVMVLFMLVFVVTFFMSLFFAPDTDEVPLAAGGILWSALAVNPVAALADAVGEAYNRDWFGDFEENGPLSEFKSEFQREFNLFDVSPELRGAMPLWVMSMLIYSILAVLSVLRSSIALRVPVKVQRWGVLRCSRAARRARFQACKVSDAGRLSSVATAGVVFGLKVWVPGWVRVVQ